MESKEVEETLSEEPDRNGEESSTDRNYCCSEGRYWGDRSLQSESEEEDDVDANLAVSGSDWEDSDGNR